MTRGQYVVRVNEFRTYCSGLYIHEVRHSKSHNGLRPLVGSWNANTERHRRRKD
jgi:hypothetical protein